MAIQHAELNIRFENSIVLNAIELSTIIADYEVFHKSWSPDTVLDRGQISQQQNLGESLIDTDAGVLAELKTRLIGARQNHKPSIDGLSLFDAGLVFDGWQMDKVSGGWGFLHSVHGQFVADIEDDILSRLQAILARFLSPPAWAWFDSPGAGQLRTKCVQVPGATSYAVYGDSVEPAVLLGTVPDHNLNTIAVAAGTYLVKMVGVIGGTAGILSIGTEVTVA